MSWLAWWNLIFLLPAAIAVLYLALYVSTGIDFGSDADADADGADDAHADANADIETEADLHADAPDDASSDAHAHAHADIDADGDHDHAEHDDPAHHGADDHGLLGYIGFGKAPLTIVLSSLGLVFGAVGLLANQSLVDNMPGPQAFAWSGPIALVSAMVVTGLFAGVFAKLFPRNAASLSRSLRQLVGLQGIAVLRISDSFGMAKVADPVGKTSQQVACRTAPGEDPIDADSPVVLMRYDRGEKIFYVTTPARLTSRGGDARLAAKRSA